MADQRRASGCGSGAGRVSRAAASRRQARSERHLAGAERSQLRSRSPRARGRRWRSAPAHTARSPRRRCWRWAPSAPCRPGSASWKAARFRTCPTPLQQKKDNQDALARARSRNQVLPAGRAARDLHAVSVSDSPERERDLLRLRIRRRDAQRLSEGSRSGAGRFLDGTVGRPLGRRYAGRRRDRIQRPVLVRSRGQFSQRRAARRRAATRAPRPTVSATKRRSRTARCSRGPGKSACRSTGVSRRTRS